MSQRFEGHNVEDALNHAAAEMGVERYRLTHRVLVEKRGFLGGVKRVVIEVDVNPDAVEPPPAARVALEETPATPSAPPRDSRGPRRTGPGGAGGGRGRGGDRGRGRGGREGGRDRDRGGRGGRGERSPHVERSSHSYSDLRPGDFERVVTPTPEQGPESDQARIVRGWCEELIDLAALSLDIRTEENENEVTVRLYGGDTRRLVDHHGELLDAFQVLANKALVGRKLEKKIEMDCEAFKERRESDLAERARAVADRVRKNGREELLPAMSPIERRIVHLTLQDDAEVTTESRGEGFYKRVAIILRSDAPAEEAPASTEP